MAGKVDLHMHTCCSDGAFTPSELVRMAKDAGLSAISITDHDSINGIQEAAKEGHRLGLEVIPGVEISTDIEDREIHLLGYFIDINNEELLKYLEFFRLERVNRARRIVKKLNDMGVMITFDNVLAFSKNSAVGRPHIAQALLEAGYVNNFYEAFDKFIGNNSPAFERKIHVSAQSALKLISDAGGLSFIAHPGFLNEKILMSLIKYGIDGIEVLHPAHNPNQLKFYRGIVNEYCLLASGGSDFHGGKRMDAQNLGRYYITPSNLEEIRNMVSKK